MISKDLLLQFYKSLAENFPSLSSIKKDELCHFLADVHPDENAREIYKKIEKANCQLENEKFISVENNDIWLNHKKLIACKKTPAREDGLSLLFVAPESLVGSYRENEPQI